MRIREVDFPEPLLDAQEGGDLVIFAGAGVSIPPPSNYPTFEELAEQVSGGALERRKDDSGKPTEPVDVFLGRLADKKIKVHDKVRKILSDPNSAPNALHSDLLRLFKKAGEVRLVTTNFDVHFTTAAKLVFGSDALEIFSAPALPPGAPLQGLVHLHGSIEKPADRLILTDSDFGRAYLTQGWATRFLQDLFARYVILFVGYSHGDPVMNYLARGLPSKSHGPGRFALAPEGRNEHWTYLGITPLTYPVGKGENKHSAVQLALTAWADLAHRGVLEHEQHIKNIVSGPVPLGGEDVEYLERMLKDFSTAQFFTRHAKTVDWLQWVQSKPCFAKLFEHSFNVGPVEQALAWWFAQEFACKHPAEALEVVRRNGETLGPALCVALGQSFHVTRPSSENLGRWIPLIIKSRPPQLRDDFLHYLLYGSRFPEEGATALLLFEHLTKPEIILKQDLWSLAKGDTAGKVDFELGPQGQDYWLRATWNTFFQPNLEVFAERLASIVTSHLEQAYSLLEACGKIYPTWDPMSASRDSIEFNPGVPTNFADLLIDMARDILLWNIEHRPARAHSLIDSWWGSRSRVLRRLAIFGVAKNSRWVADRKANWLLENDLLYARGLKPETVLLLEAGYREASEPARVALLEKIANGPPGDLGEDYKEREIFNLFLRTTQAAPDCPHARARLDELVSRHPEWAPREPSEAAGGVSEDGKLRSPIQTTELLAKAPQEWVERLVSYKPQNLREPSREGLLEHLAEALRQDFEWGLNLARALSSATRWESDLAGDRRRLGKAGPKRRAVGAGTAVFERQSENAERGAIRMLLPLGEREQEGSVRNPEICNRDCGGGG